MNKLTIGQVEEKLQGIENENDPFLQEIAIDERKGVARLVAKWHRNKALKQQIHDKFIKMTKFEQDYYNAGYRYIAGIDEVGRGPLAGPVVSAAVILPQNFYLPGIDDSKKLTESKREDFFHIISKQAIAIGVGIIGVEEIDNINIYEATKKSMLSAITQLHVQPDFLLIDAMKLESPYPTESIIKGDSKSISIAAASIIAKETRDRMMKKYGEEYPGYFFEKNMGYGTQDHLGAIERQGITAIHRKTFAPIKDYIK